MAAIVASDVPVPWRPVQYLGSKLRSVQEISQVVEGLTDGQTTVWDAFSGSSVVSQQLASRGHRVVATDALAACATFASALLGVGRTPGSTSSLEDLATRAAQMAADGGQSPWDRWLDREREATASNDGARLLSISAELPQRWRPEGADPSLARLFDVAEAEALEGEVPSSGLLSTLYAGTYFGLSQAISLERIRSAIDILAPQGAAGSSWARAALLTSLCHSASSAAFSPGKHFAQPHRVHSEKELSFHRRRILQDRSVDVLAAFIEAARKVDSLGALLQGPHHAEQRLVANQPRDLITRFGVSTVYADPPYTAQQYSRFYHVLDVIVHGRTPKLQLVKGRVTRGLYPEGKYLSPFSSRRQAPLAFTEMIRAAKESGCHIVISYSAARGSQTGNARMISLEELERITADTYGASNASVQELDVRYRQFNRADVGVPGRDDPEFLVIGRSNAL